MDPNRLLTLAGLAVWAGVGVVLFRAGSPVAGIAWAGWLPGFLLATRERPAADRLHHAGLLLEVGSALVTVVAGHELGAALLCVSAGQLPFFVGARAGLAVIGAQTAALAGVEVQRDGAADGLLTALVYGSFQLFALGAATLAVRERAAREVVLRMNAELLAAREALAEAERRGERLRIARDLHDAVGHRLTALGLQLELAARTAPSSPVLAARDLSKQLLAEVRLTVGALRDGPVDLAAGLRALAALPRPRVHLGDPVPVTGPAAEALLRCAQEAVTNAARHGRAAEVWLALVPADGGVALTVRDDGPGGAAPEGNGLRGMRERLAAVGGHLELAEGPGFPLRAWVPR